MDIFTEQIVKKKKTVQDTIVKISIILCLILIPFAFTAIAQLTHTAYFIVVGFFLVLIGIYVAWYLITSLKQEFEYSVTNDNLTVDKIIAKRKRKKMLSMDIKKIDELSKLNSEDFDKRKYDKVIFAAESADDENVYACSFTTEKYGKCLLAFSPNEKVLNAMKPHLKKDIVLKLFYNR
ncbi:MAG: DUF6106 family protein [Acutalibacteraceae bacterium]